MASYAITSTDRIECGPAMNALNDRQRKFVMAWNNSGYSNASECARAAGYFDAGNGAIAVQAHSLLHNPRIQAAVIEDAKARLTGDLGSTWDEVDKIAKNPQHTRQLDALKLKLTHAGMIEKTAIEHQITVSPTLEQQIDELIRIKGRENVDPRYLRVLEGEYKDITPSSEEPETW
jgi:phage terminase small subunit